MKRFTKILSAVLIVFMMLGAVTVSADNGMVIMPNRYVEVYLSVEGPDGLYAFTSGFFPGNGSLSAGDAITALLEEDYPDMEFTGISDGYITSLNGVEGGTFGGWDGWVYVVEYRVTDENGEPQYYTDIPSVGMNDYMINDACHITVYYGDYDDALAGYTITDDGMIKLVSYVPVFDDNYNVISFDESPLAGGSFNFTPINVDETTGETTYGETIEIIADENGLTKLDADFRAVPNGQYIGSVGKQSDETATIGDITLTKPEVARYSFIYNIDNKPTPEEIFIQQVFMLLVAMLGGRG